MLSRAAGFDPNVEMVTLGALVERAQDSYLELAAGPEFAQPAGLRFALSDALLDGRRYE